MIYYILYFQEGTMNIWNFFEKEEQVKDMDSPQKGRTSPRYEPSSNKGGSG